LIVRVLGMLPGGCFLILLRGVLIVIHFLSSLAASGRFMPSEPCEPGVDRLGESRALVAGTGIRIANTAFKPPRCGNHWASATRSGCWARYSDGNYYAQAPAHLAQDSAANLRHASANPSTMAVLGSAPARLGP
jgi:hypothetical protein